MSKLQKEKIPDRLDFDDSKWEEVQQGRWIYAHCPFCGITADIPTNYCPQCGADMRKEDEKMEIDMRTEIEYIERRRLTMVDEEGIKYWTCEEVGELIRCKDCKHYVKSDVEHPDCDFCKRLICGTIDFDFFCADGERREENETDRR